MQREGEQSSRSIIVMKIGRPRQSRDARRASDSRPDAGRPTMTARGRFGSTFFRVGDKGGIAQVHVFDHALARWADGLLAHRVPCLEGEVVHSLTKIHAAPTHAAPVELSPGTGRTPGGSQR